MKKFLSLLLILMILLVSLVGCGKTEEVSNEKNDILDMDSDKITHDTKVKNLSESYTKFTEIKNRVMEKLSEKAAESENYMISASISGMAMVDVIALPATVCGLGEQSANASLGLMYSGVSYKEDGNTYTITYKNDDGEGKYVAQYDPDTDSAIMDLYENGEKVATVEYIKIDNGYASQFYSIENEEDKTYMAYKSLFTDDNVVTGMYEEMTNVPDKIYKKATTCNEEWVKSGKSWIEYKNGIGRAIIDGEEMSF